MSGRFLGSFLVERGLATREQVDQAAAYQAEANRRLGEHAVQAGLLTPGQVEELLAEQKLADASFGELAVARGLVPRSAMDALLFRQHVNQVHLGEALLVLGHLTRDQFCDCLARYEAEEASRREMLAAMLADLPGGEALAALVGALERAFLRFAACPLKAHGRLTGEMLESLGHAFTSEAPLEGGGTVRFTLRLGQRMLSLLAASQAGREPDQVVPEVLEVICRYMAQALAADLGAKAQRRADLGAHPEPDREGPGLGLLLACPRAEIGLTARVDPPGSRLRD